MSASWQDNSPELWRAALPVPRADGHKYHRGHALILGAPELTGATRLAAGACSRIGAGLVTVSASQRADIYRTALQPDIMVTTGGIEAVRHPTVVLAGSGGLGPAEIEKLHDVPPDIPLVLDAAAMAQEPRRKVNDASIVLTPHDGEFLKLFVGLDDDRRAGALRAAKARRAIIALKGSQTLITAPDGRAVVNTHASPYLAKAGTGDVLAGLIAGLIAQGMPAFDATCAAVWVHGEAGLQIGPGLVAGDIEARVPAILKDLLDA